MTNKEIYKATLVFSVRRLLYDIVCFLVLGLLAGGGFLLADKLWDKGLVGLAVGLVAGILILVFALRYGSYTFKAGQIAMMTRAVTEGSLPDDVFGEGVRVVRSRFLTVALYFTATGIIKGIFNQLGKSITNIGKAIGGDTGKSVGSAISTAVQVMVAYLCDCCLGWVFYRSDENAARATCEGAVLFFRHGKTLLKNMGRIFGMGLVSLLIIGGAFTGVFMAIFSRFPQFFEMLSSEMAEAAAQGESEIAQLLTTPQGAMFFCAALAGVILWSMLHSAFVRPFVLTGVLRNYLLSGMDQEIDESAFAQLDQKSPKFAKLHRELA